MKFEVAESELNLLLKNNIRHVEKFTLPEKSPYSEFFWSVFDVIRSSADH